MHPSDLARAVILDFESVPDVSGRPFPVEVGMASGRYHRSYPIKPKGTWLPGKPSWDGHEESLRRAKEEGIQVDKVAAWILKVTSGRPVLSDACFVDQPLLEAMFANAETAPKLIPFFPTVQAYATTAGVGKTTLDRWICEIDEGRGPAHRAGEDARVRAELLARILDHAPVAPS